MRVQILFCIYNLEKLEQQYINQQFDLDLFGPNFIFFYKTGKLS